MKKICVLILIFFAIFSIRIYAQNEVQPQKRIALVIGNGNYPSSTLANPENDAKAMSDVLQKLGFTVLKYENLGQEQMKRAIDDFGLRLKGNDIGLFFYAGHGIQSKGFNFLIPIDAQLQTEQDVEYDCVQADRILGKMEGSGTKVNIIILDACRNNPFERSWTRSENGRGLATMNAPIGTLIAYSTSPGSTAQDGSSNNSPYTSAILESILTDDISIIQMFQNVTRMVSEKSSKQQTPWISSSLTGDFYFNNSLFSEIQQKDRETLLPEINIESGKTGVFIDYRDNNQYKTIKIGNQIWMAENLNYETERGSAVYKHDPLLSSPYGRLYVWEAAKNACPIGWHIPKYSEWEKLKSFLGGENVAGGKMKETGSAHWESPNTGATNESGFSAVPGGYLGGSGGSYFEGRSAYYWSSSPSKRNGILICRLFHNSAKADFHGAAKECGFSVRCVKD